MLRYCYGVHTTLYYYSKLGYIACYTHFHCCGLARGKKNFLGYTFELIPWKRRREKCRVRESDPTLVKRKPQWKILQRRDKRWKEREKKMTMWLSWLSNTYIAAWKSIRRKSKSKPFFFFCAYDTTSMYVFTSSFYFENVIEWYLILFPNCSVLQFVEWGRNLSW